MSEPDMTPRTVEELLFWCRVAGMKPGDLTIRTDPEEWLRLVPRSVIGVDEDGYVWIDRRKPG